MFRKRQPARRRGAADEAKKQNQLRKKTRELHVQRDRLNKTGSRRNKTPARHVATPIAAAMPSDRSAGMLVDAREMYPSAVAIAQTVTAWTAVCTRDPTCAGDIPRTWPRRAALTRKIP